MDRVWSAVSALLNTALDINIAVLIGLLDTDQLLLEGDTLMMAFFKCRRVKVVLRLYMFVYYNPTSTD